MLSQEEKEFLKIHQNDDVQKLLLNKHKYAYLDVNKLIDQIIVRRKAQLKFPKIASVDNVFFPPALSFEQASSEQTADYKKTFVKDLNVADATGGFGIDSLYFASVAKKLWYIEQQEQLCGIFQHNATVLNYENVVFVCGNSMEYLAAANEKWDLIYLDPARRGVNNNKLFSLLDCEPNVVEFQDMLFEKANQILIKASPMLDISLALKQLKHVTEVHVLSLKNECKELLFLCQRFNVNPVIKAVELDAEHAKPFIFKQTEEQSVQVVYATEMKRYLYDPFVSVMKSGAFKLIGERFGLEKIHPHAHIYTSNELHLDFPGRIFEILNTFSPKEIKLHLPSMKANVARRHFPMSPDEIRKMYKISDGGQSYLFYTTMTDHTKCVILASRIA